MGTGADGAVPSDDHARARAHARPEREAARCAARGRERLLGGAGHRGEPARRAGRPGGAAARHHGALGDLHGHRPVAPGGGGAAGCRRAAAANGGVQRPERPRESSRQRLPRAHGAARPRDAPAPDEFVQERGPRVRAAGLHLRRAHGTGAAAAGEDPASSRAGDGGLHPRHHGIPAGQGWCPGPAGGGLATGRGCGKRGRGQLRAVHAGVCHALEGRAAELRRRAGLPDGDRRRW
mmetsp:Transcript_45811/g.141760  ORF Transcript_45811/g.141760 Transcript_45811/m.141760 type:complete len:236 (+) Transcript_45811:1536-2243(+)